MRTQELDLEHLADRMIQTVCSGQFPKRVEDLPS